MAQGPVSDTPPAQGTTPLEAAVAVANTFIVTLHPKLQHFVEELIGGALKDASKFHQKSKKLNKMCTDPTYIPANCQIVGIVHQA